MHLCHLPSISLEVAKAGTSPSFWLGKQTQTMRDTKTELSTDPNVSQVPNPGPHSRCKTTLGKCLPLGEMKLYHSVPPGDTQPRDSETVWRSIDMDCAAKERLWQGPALLLHGG